MLLAIDVGNTNIVLGVFDRATLIRSWRLQTLRERTADELGLLVDALFDHDKIDRSKVRGIVLGSVVPPLTTTTREMVERYFGVSALTIEPGTETGMPILYDNPAEVGADRIVNGIAAYDRFGHARRPPAAHRHSKARATRRPHDGRLDGIRTVLGLCRSRGGARPAHERRARR